MILTKFHNFDVCHKILKGRPELILAKKLFYQLKICLSPEKIGFLGKTLFGSSFYQGHMYIFEISMNKWIFDTTFNLIKEKKFASQ